MTTIKKLKCGCDNNYYCRTVELLWAMANKIYHISGYDAWKACPALAEYNAHRKELYDQTRSSKNTRKNA